MWCHRLDPMIIKAILDKYLGQLDQILSKCKIKMNELNSTSNEKYLFSEK
jgi:hypothetical protein